MTNTNQTTLQWDAVRRIIQVLQEVDSQDSRELNNMSRSLQMGNPITPEYISLLQQKLQQIDRSSGVSPIEYRIFESMSSAVQENPSIRYYPDKVSELKEPKTKSAAHREWQKVVAQNNGYDTVTKMMQDIRDGVIQVAPTEDGSAVGRSMLQGFDSEDACIKGMAKGDVFTLYIGQTPSDYRDALICQFDGMVAGSIYPSHTYTELASTGVYLTSSPDTLWVKQYPNGRHYTPSPPHLYWNGKSLTDGTANILFNPAPAQKNGLLRRKTTVETPLDSANGTLVITTNILSTPMDAKSFLQKFDSIQSNIDMCIIHGVPIIRPSVYATYQSTPSILRYRHNPDKTIKHLLKRTNGKNGRIIHLRYIKIPHWTDNTIRNEGYTGAVLGVLQEKVNGESRLYTITLIASWPFKIARQYYDLFGGYMIGEYLEYNEIDPEGVDCQIISYHGDMMVTGIVTDIDMKGGAKTCTIQWGKKDD